MKIKLSPLLVEKIPGLAVAAIVIKGLNNKKKNSTIEQLLRGVCAEKKRQFKKDEKEQFLQLFQNISSDNGVLAEAQLLESGLKKAIKGTEIVSTNNLHGIIHYLSLKYLLPVQGRDLDEVEKDLEISFIAPKKGKKIEDLAITTNTTNIVMWFINIGSYTAENFEKLPADLIKIIEKYCKGTQVDTYFLNALNPEVDLQYISEKEEQYLQKQLEEEQEKKLKETILQTDEAPFLASEESANTAFLLAETPVKEKLLTVLSEAVQKFTGEQDIKAIEIITPDEASHGDYATSIALKLSKQLNRPPREIAVELQALLPVMEEVAKTEIAGPGFINFHLSDSYRQKQLEKSLSLREHFGRLTIGKNQKVIIEYSQPNIAKPLGVHHLLSTIIGQTLVDMYRFGGFNVHAINYPGDWGTQFGKLIYAYRTWGNEETVKKDPLNELLKLYVQFHKEAEQDPTLDDKGRAEFKKLEEGDEENRKLWQWMKDLSIEEIERLYKKLGVHFDEYLGEQMHLEEAKKLIQEGKEKGIFVEGERGALIVQFENEKYPPYMVQKADGTTLYSSRDIASIKYRLEHFNPQRIVYVVDVAQSLHFKQLFETAQKFGFNSAELVHVSFGRMQFPEGGMSTRKGEIILLDEVIKEAIVRTEKIIAEKSRELSTEEQKKVAEAMAISAIKYNILSQNREINMTFDWDRMLSLDGNSGPYLQYAYARAKSILRKAQEQKTPATSLEIENQQISIFNLEQEKNEETTKVIKESKDQPIFGYPTEQTLLRMVALFPERLEQAIIHYKPHIISNYLFELAQAFSHFYNEVSVLNAATPQLKEARLKLVESTSIVLKNGLKILGLAVFEKM